MCAATYAVSGTLHELITISTERHDVYMSLSYRKHTLQKVAWSEVGKGRGITDCRCKSMNQDTSMVSPLVGEALGMKVCTEHMMQDNEEITKSPDRFKTFQDMREQESTFWESWSQVCTL